MINNKLILSLSFLFLMSTNQSFASDFEENPAKDANVSTPRATMVQPFQESLPAGVVMAYAGRAAPAGWLLCNGKIINSNDYPNLYASIGRDYVTPDMAHRLDESLFCLPDLKGRVIVGVDNGAGRVTSNNTLGASGGEERHQLTIDEMPSHRHSQFGRTGALNKDGSGNPISYGGEDPSGPAGGDQPHNNMQPYLALNYIIKH